MSYKGINSAMLDQSRGVVRDLNLIADTIDFEYLKKSIPEETLKDIEKVILTGCGDSYCAAIAARPIFENCSPEYKGLGTFSDAQRNVEFTRYYNTYKGWDAEEAKKTLVAAISISGAPARPIEALLRIKEKGGKAVAYTGNMDSEFAKSASNVVELVIPPNEHAPNIASYLGSMFPLMTTGIYFNVVKGRISWAKAQEMRNVFLEYINSFTPEIMDDIESKAYHLAKKWLDDGIEIMDFISEGQNFATSFFGSAKMVEAFGGLITHDDSEDWAHINFFNRKPKNMGTFILANESAPSFGRTMETVKVADALGRPLAIITEADPSIFPEKATVFSMPKPKYDWMNPIMQHIPYDFVAAHMMLLMGIPDFRPDSPAHQLDKEAKRFRKSKIAVV